MLNKIFKKNNIYFLLFLFSIGVYLFTHFVKIEDFPIYFFSDEAMLPVKAEQIIKNGLKDENNSFLPLMIKTNKIQPGMVMYLQMPFILLFGKKIWVVRGLNVLITLIGTIFIALILKNIFKFKNYWLAILFVSGIPLFFIHSRAEFNTGIATSFYAISLYFYFLYRTRSPNLLFLSILFMALSFYSYFGIWLTLIINFAMLTLVDFSYHLKNIKVVILCFLIAILFFTPFIKYQLTHISNTLEMVKEYDYELFKEGLGFKFWKKVGFNYIQSFNPKFLFFNDDSYNIRHTLKGYGYFPAFSIPFIMLGLVYLILHLNEPVFRILLLILITSSLGGTLAGPGATRIMPMIIPLALLFVLGLKTIKHLQWQNNIIISLFLFISLSSYTINMTGDSLTNGSLWFKDYGLYGMQYGAKQLFQEAIPQYLKNNPGVQLNVSSNWANNADVFRDFFLSEKEKNKVQINNIDYFTEYLRPIPTNLVLIMTPEELKKTKESKKFKKIKILETIPYPDGNTGFYFVKISYVDNVDEIFGFELKKRRELVTEDAEINGAKIKVVHSRFDSGTIKEVFDKDHDTLARGWEANPMIVELYFPQIEVIDSISADIGIVTSITFTLKLFSDELSEPEIYVKKYSNNTDKSIVTFNFKKRNVDKIRIEIKEDFRDLTKIHLREIEIN